MGKQAKFWGWFLSIDKPEGSTVSLSHGQSPAQNRNILIQQALQHDCTHIFFIDDDVLIPKEALVKLLAHDKDIVSGLYLMRSFPHAPIAFNIAHTDGKCRFKFLNNDETGLVEVVNFGLGCCLIKTDVFRKMPAPWIRIGQLNSQEWNDDIDFFNRAREAGYRLWLDLDVRAGHMATVTLWPEYVDGKWITSYDSNGAGHASFYAAHPKQYYPDDEYEKMLEATKSTVSLDLSHGIR